MAAEDWGDTKLDVDEGEVVESLRAGELWEDPHFAANDMSLYLDLGNVPEYAEQEPRLTQGPHSWLRPNEYAKAPALFKDGIGSGNVVPGQLNDVWLLGALAAAANHPAQLVRNLVVSETDEGFLQSGVITFQFYKDGDWVPVSIDSRVPYGDPETVAFNSPVYGRCRDPNEVWVPLMEKALAKLHSNYEVLNGGSVCEALADITGGVSQSFFTTDPRIKELIEGGRLWHKFKKYLAKSYVLACCKYVPDGGSEADPATGLLVNHAYSVLHLKEVGALKFVKVRNPWGQGVWHGDWSDGWSKWDQHPDVESALLDDPECGFDRNVRDGTFWMIWEDFVVHFNKVYVCRVFGEEWNQYLIPGRWGGLAAAGAHKVLRERVAKPDDGGAEEKGGEEKTGGAAGAGSGSGGGGTAGSGGNKYRGSRPDGDSQWFHNPQFRILTSKPGKCTISLSQADRKMLGLRDNVPIRFVVIRQRRGAKTRVWEEVPEDVVADSTQANFASVLPKREVAATNIQLDPKFSYVVVPHTLERGKECNFTLRIFSPLDLSIEEVAVPHSARVTGAWARETAGGPLRLEGRTNPSWCLNPQFWITRAGAPTKRKVELKFVLHRTDRKVGRDDKSDGTKNKVGMVVTRVQPPPPDNPRRRKPGQLRTNALGETLPAKESSLKRPLGTTAFDATATAATAVGQDETKERELPRRKLEVLPTDVCLSSDFSNAAVATVLVTVPGDWLNDGLLVHPCMKLLGRDGDFTLTAYSSHRVQLRELAQGNTRTVAGSWTDKTAMGSHLHPDWKRNPAFQVTPLDRVPRSSARITLSRPEERWKGPCKQDSVGCMLGFYIVTCDRERDSKFHDGRTGNPNMETNFVPMHTVVKQVDLNFDALPEGKVYVIIPATFEPGKEGPFHLSVTMDVEFALTPHNK